MAEESEMTFQYVKADDCPITKVTVYKDRAEVCRNYNGKIQAGKNELHITHFVEADEDSIRVEGQGKATIAEVSFQKRKNKGDAAKSEKEKALEEELECLNKKLKDSQFESQVNGLTRQRQILDQFATTASTTRTGDSKESVLTNEYFQGIRGFLHQYKEINQQLEAEKLDIEKKKEELLKKIQDVRTEMEKLGRERTLAQDKKECIIVLDAEGETELSLSISYIVYKASWNPSYDLRMFTDEGILKIYYFGIIKQTSGEDWTNVNVSLSTAEPVLGGSIPILPQTQLSVSVPYRPKSYHKRIKARAASLSFKSASMNHCQAQDFSAGESLYDRHETDSLEFDELKVTVAIIETSPTLSYLTIPSKVLHAFLEAKVTNPSPYILMPGPTNIFLDNTSVGKAQLKAVAPQEEFECSLGVDQGVRVDYKPASEVASSSGLLSKVKIMQYKQMIEVKNTHVYDIKVKVRENLPKSQDEKIKVKLLEPLIDTKKPEKTAKDVVLTEENHVEWDLKIPAMKKAEAVLMYTVEHPTDVVLETNEVLGSK
ncbi:protein F37C4.5 [Elysia marginata]|uniref:Protein F37C4.5 n=1 Tax=Elysia marginata TaxID=1093978 RepID=A0AAV4IJV7_9GAST|nr:protein F37C4.5 [Elysia marginata]